MIGWLVDGFVDRLFIFTLLIGVAFWSILHQDEIKQIFSDYDSGRYRRKKDEKKKRFLNGRTVDDKQTQHG